MKKYILRSEKLNREVDIYVYLPKSYKEDRKYPVVYMHDGQNLSDPSLTTYGHVWNVEALESYKIPELIIVGISSPKDGQSRMNELCPYKNDLSAGLGIQYLNFVSEVVGFIDDEFSTKRNPEDRMMIGSSMGGVITTYAAAHYTHLFNKFAALSNAYWSDKRILDEIPLIKNVKFYMDVGTNEGRDDYVEHNDEAFNLLKNKDSFYVKIPGALHNEEEWAVRLPMIIRWMFGGRK